MSDKRSLPERPSLRHLRLEAKRRRAAGEFPTLHGAQLAVAREHGQPSWAALREAVAAAGAAAGSEGHALAQLRWIAARFGDAGTPGWTRPGDDELRAHFTDRFLASVPPDRLVAMITDMAGELHADLTVIRDAPFVVVGQLAGHLIQATTEPRPPYRLIGVRARRLGARISDPRAASPATMAVGEPPAVLPELAGTILAQLGLPGLSLAGGTGGQVWATATGWADLDTGAPLTPGHAFPAHGVTSVVTGLCVLRLVAGGRLRLDDRVSRYPGRVRLADEAVTVRELLSHTAGVTDPPGLFRPTVPDLTEVTGPVLACGGRRGAFEASIAGYAVLGELVAQLAGEPYEDAAERLVLAPLRMRSSWFPKSWPDGPGPGDRAPGGPPAGDRAPGDPATPGRTAVTGYDVTADGAFTSLDDLVCALPAGGGLWTTAADLVRLGLGWRSLLPRSLAVQVLRPHAVQPNGIDVGLGWAVNEGAGVAGCAGDGPGTSASLLITLDGRHAGAALASRQILLEPAAGQALGAAIGAARAEPGR